MATTGVYEWKKPTPKLPGVNGGEAPKSPMDPMAAPTQGQSSTSMFGPTEANKSAVAGGDFNSMFNAGATAPTPSFNDLFAGAGDQRQQNIQAAQTNISQGFQPQGESAATTQARNQFQKAQDEAQRQVLEQAALSGRGETGQIIGDNREFLTKQALPQAMDFEAMLQTNEQASNRQRAQEAMGNLLSLEGLGSQERSQQAQLSLQEKQLGESARQFNTQQAFTEWATKEGWSQDAINRAWQSEEAAKERASREGVAFAGLSLEEKKLAQEGSQFASRLDFDKWATQAGLDNQTATRIWQSIENEKERGSAEKIAFAQLSVKEKELAQQGAQFKDELAFKKFATEGGWSQQEADRAWQSLENEKEISSREKISFAQLSMEEKALAQEGAQFRDRLSFDKWATQVGLDDKQADRIWQANENEKERTARAEESGLSRELQKYIADRGFAIDDKQLAETVRQFDGKMAFDKWATQAGLDDNEKGRIWQGHLQDLEQKWQSGERLGSQEHQSLIEDKRIQAQTAAQEFDRVANLEALGKTQEWDAAKLAITNGYQTARDAGQMSHEQAMQAAKMEMERNLAVMGLDAQTARQAAEIEARKWETERQIAHESAIANAELLFKNQSLLTQSGLERERLNQNAQEIANQAAQFAQSFGLEETRVKEMLNNEKSSTAIGNLSVLMELAGDNPDMMDLASRQFFTTMKDMGIMSPEEATRAIQELNNPPPPSTGPTNDYSTDDALNRWAGGYSQIARGDIVDGLGNVIAGSFSTPVALVKDGVTAVTSGAKKAGNLIKSLF